MREAQIEHQPHLQRSGYLLVLAVCWQALAGQQVHQCSAQPVRRRSLLTLQHPRQLGLTLRYQSVYRSAGRGSAWISLLRTLWKVIKYFGCCQRQARRLATVLLDSTAASSARPCSRSSRFPNVFLQQGCLTTHSSTCQDCLYRAHRLTCMICGGHPCPASPLSAAVAWTRLPFSPGSLPPGCSSGSTPVQQLPAIMHP